MTREGWHTRRRNIGGLMADHGNISELMALGFIQEANRLFFHSCGLALEAESAWEKLDLDAFFEFTGRTEPQPEHYELLEAFIRFIGWDDWHLSTIRDARSDDEGYIFQDLSAEEVKQKMINVKRERRKHEHVRRAMFNGSIVQPIGSRYGRD
jgi:hypothetical protein